MNHSVLYPLNEVLRCEFSDELRDYSVDGNGRIYSNRRGIFLSSKGGSGYVVRDYYLNKSDIIYALSCYLKKKHEMTQARQSNQMYAVAINHNKAASFYSTENIELLDEVFASEEQALQYLNTIWDPSSTYFIMEIRNPKEVKSVLQVGDNS